MHRGEGEAQAYPAPKWGSGAFTPRKIKGGRVGHPRSGKTQRGNAASKLPRAANSEARTTEDNPPTRVNGLGNTARTQVR